MRKHQVIILAFLIIFSACKKSQNKKEYIKVNTQEKQNKQKEEEIIKITRSDTLFLSFSPNMSETEFTDAKIRENNVRLKNGKFSISLNNQIIDFNVYQKNKAIGLVYSKYISRNDLKNHYHEEIFNELISIFNNKYKYHNYVDFDNYINFESSTKTYRYHNPIKKDNDSLLKHLNEYGFYRTNYAVFDDSKKIIVVGFSAVENEYDILDLLNSSPVPINGFKNNDDKSYIIREKIEPDDIKSFNYTMSIDYFLKKDFDSIKNIVNKDFSTYMKSIMLQLENNNKNRKKLENNKSEL